MKLIVKKLIVIGVILIFTFIIFNFVKAVYVFVAGKSYEFSIVYTTDPNVKINGIYLEAKRNNLVITSTSCTDVPCSLSYVYFFTQISTFSESLVTGTISALESTFVTTTLNIYLQNETDQKALVSSFDFIIVSTTPSLSFLVYYNTSSALSISGQLVASTTFDFFGYDKATKTAWAGRYVTSSPPNTQVSTTAADVRRISEYALFWTSNDLIENSCSLTFTDKNNNNNSILLFSDASTTGLVFVTTSPDFYHQYGGYTINCLAQSADCSITDTLISCPPASQISSEVSINTETTWYRCFYGFCISNPGKTPTEKYVFPTYQECTQKCFLDIREIAP